MVVKHMNIIHEIRASDIKLPVNYERQLGAEWSKRLESTLRSGYMSHLNHYIHQLYARSEFVYPRNKLDIMKAYRSVPFDKIRVVIFNNEIAPNNFSNGLAFGEYGTKDQKTRHSTVSYHFQDLLERTYPEVKDNYDPTLDNVAQQGVLLLNTSLVSESKQPMHHHLMFRHFIRKTVETISNHHVGTIFVFTNEHQYYFEKYIDKEYSHVLKVDGVNIRSKVNMFEEINKILEDEEGGEGKINWGFN